MNIAKPRLEKTVKTFIQSGTRFLVEVGTKPKPGLVRWTTWGHNDIQQSYLLSTSDGSILINPIRPIGRQALNALREHADGRFQAVVCTSPNHERDVEWFRKQFKIPVYGPELAPARSRIRLKSDELYRDGDILPGSIRAIWSGDKRGEMWLLWRASRTSRVLICADSIYGQSRRGGFDGATVPYWIQEGGIRLQMNGEVSPSEMRRRYEVFEDYEFGIVLNGHNPRPIENAKSALERALSQGKYETHPKRAFSVIAADLSGE